MGNIKPFPQEKLMTGIIINPAKADISEVREKLISSFGETDLEAGPFPFHHTEYYNKEMGTPLFKHLFAFKALVPPDHLPDIKIRTNEIEASHYSHEKGRYVNLDPGLVNGTRLILATTKNYAHRIPLQKGIYAEITLVYHKKKWEFLDWTYPDFRTEEYLNFLTLVRTRYLEQIKAS